MSDKILRNANQNFTLPGLPAGVDIVMNYDETKNEINETKNAIDNKIKRKPNNIRYCFLVFKILISD